MTSHHKKANIHRINLIKQTQSDLSNSYKEHMKMESYNQKFKGELLINGRTYKEYLQLPKYIIQLESKKFTEASSSSYISNIKLKETASEKVLMTSNKHIYNTINIKPLTKLSSLSTMNYNICPSPEKRRSMCMKRNSSSSEREYEYNLYNSLYKTNSKPLDQNEKINKMKYLTPIAYKLDYFLNNDKVKSINYLKGISNVLSKYKKKDNERFIDFNSIRRMTNPNIQSSPIKFIKTLNFRNENKTFSTEVIQTEGIKANLNKKISFHKKDSIFMNRRINNNKVSSNTINSSFLGEDDEIIILRQSPIRKRDESRKCSLVLDERESDFDES